MPETEQREGQTKAQSPEQDARDHPLFSKWLTDQAAILAALPIAGYLLAYLHEAGYARICKVPIELVSISGTQVFYASVMTILFVAVIHFVEWNRLRWSNQKDKEKNPILHFYLACITYVASFGLLVSPFVGFNRYGLMAAVRFDIFMLVLQHARLLGYPRGVSFRERCKNDICNNPPSFRESLRSPRLMLATALMAGVAAYGTGGTKLQRHDSFYVDVANTNRIFLASYAGRDIFGVVTTNAQTVRQRGFNIVEVTPASERVTLELRDLSTYLTNALPFPGSFPKRGNMGTGVVPTAIAPAAKP